MMKTWLMRRAVRMPVSLCDDLGHQFVGVQAALHQRLGFALAHQLDRLRRRGVAVRRIDELVGRDVEAEARRQRADARLRPDQDRLDDLRLRRLDRAAQRGLVARMRHRRAHRRQRVAGVNERFVFFVLAGVGHGGGCSSMVRQS